MSWPRFRGRNSLTIRPNYYSGSSDAPPSDSGQLQSQDTKVSSQYLSGEIDRMVYGWWLSSLFQEAAAAYAGITIEELAAVQEAMLTWDFIWTRDGKVEYVVNKNNNDWKGIP